VAQEASIDPAEAFLGDGADTISIEELFSNTSHLGHLRTTDSLFLTAGRVDG
jgi:hypothetical protein